MELLELLKIIKKYYSYKASKVYFDSERNEVIAELYEAIITKYHIDYPHDDFYAGVVIDKEESILAGKILGKEMWYSSKEEDIVKALEIVDYYCRLRLPDKFLEANDKAYKIE